CGTIYEPCSEVQLLAGFRELYPRPHRLEREAPRLQNPERLWHEYLRRPDHAHGIRHAEIADWQRLDLVERKACVVALCALLPTLWTVGRERPGWVGQNDAGLPDWEHV